MTLDFRIDWGYQYLYSRRHYHPQYIWDGNLECDGGTIKEIYSLDYPVIWFGPGHCAVETRLCEPKWTNRTKRGVSGIHVICEADENTVFKLNTVSCDLTFTAEDIINKGRIDIPVGPKYQDCAVVITRTDYLWFRPEPKKDEQSFDITSLSVPCHNWMRMKLAWLAPGQSAKWEAEVKNTDCDYTEQLLHLVAMGVPAAPAKDHEDREIRVDEHIPLELIIDGKSVMRFNRYYRQHDDYMQLLEDDWKRFTLAPGKHTFELKNCHDKVGLGISKLTLKPCGYNHGQLSIPEWALKNEKVTGKVYAVREDIITVMSEGKETKLSCKTGWNEFEIKTPTVGNIAFDTFSHKQYIEIIDAEEESCPIKVGYDMTVVPHDENGYMDWLIDYTQRTRLGNYILFRPFNPIDDFAPFRKWGEFCRTHGIYSSICRQYMGGEFIEGAGDMLHDCGLHEYPGAVYAFDPREPYISKDMKEASEKYMDYLKIEIDKIHSLTGIAAFGDASGGIRYSYLAGVDFVRAETMVGHTQLLLSQTRPACEALGDGRWGVHIAIQHGKTLYHMTHLGAYFLSLFQPWIMGAETIYEEDSLFELFKEERQSWDDVLTKGKRDMTRKFFKFVKTHPRKGNCVRNIAFLEGRYAAPFNGFICDVEQDPHYSVWGLFGNPDPSWGHAQPEKCRQILDVLMPGASTHPFRQKFDKRRFYFSGTPYGDFDCVPVEASSEYLGQYKLLLNLGWNTAIQEDMEKFRTFAQNGGTILTGIPQFSTHTGREFLVDMKDLALINGGDLSDICGIKVLGRGVEYCGQFNCKNRESIPEPELSAMPSDSTEEDGKAYLAKVELCGAEIVAWDTFSGEPMLVRNKVGDGYVYTFTLWAYPGHEKFQGFAASFVALLSGESMTEAHIEDNSGEVFWTVWQDGEKTRIYMLNTDWTSDGNAKKVTAVCGEHRLELSVYEKTLVEVTYENGKFDTSVHSL